MLMGLQYPLVSITSVKCCLSSLYNVLPTMWCWWASKIPWSLLHLSSVACPASIMSFPLCDVDGPPRSLGLYYICQVLSVQPLWCPSQYVMLMGLQHPLVSITSVKFCLSSLYNVLPNMWCWWASNIPWSLLHLSSVVCPASIMSFPLCDVDGPPRSLGLYYICQVLSVQPL